MILFSKKNIYFLIHLVTFVLLFCTACLKTDAMELISPNKKIKVEIQFAPKNDSKFGQVSFKVDYLNEHTKTEVLPSSPLGLVRKDQPFSDGLVYVSESKPFLIHEEYKMLHGKKSNGENFCNEKTFRFKNAEGSPIDLIFRAYNDGVAFRYSFPNQADSAFQITDERTAYSIPNGTKRWIQPFDLSYEGYFPLNTTWLSDKKEQEWGYPALYQKDNLFVLISEANLSRFNSATRLCNKENPQLYKVSLPSQRSDYQTTATSITLPWKSQWHVLMIGNLANIVESTLIGDLSEPCKLKDTEWIKPGAASWIYWANNHGSKDYQKIVEYIDLAVKMNWPYVLIDWEWNVMGNGGTIEDAVKYANSKGIKPLMWYNSGTAWLGAAPADRLLKKEKRIKEFEWLNKIGVYGVKIDFFAGDQQDMVNYYIDLLEDAAAHHLMVNFHGATLPRGWERTYPNLMSTEAVLGAEWYNNNDKLTPRAASHNATLPFTRNVVGSMDYTPVTFSNSQHPHITSYAHELALSVVFESALQHFADKPSAYLDLPDAPKNFLKTVPTAWDETKLIEGYPGENIIIARRKGDKWYVGGINGTNDPMTFKFNPSFLKKGSYNLQVIKDGSNDQSFETVNKKISKKDTIEVKCLPRGGFVCVIE